MPKNFTQEQFLEELKGFSERVKQRNSREPAPDLKDATQAFKDVFLELNLAKSAVLTEQFILDHDLSFTLITFWESVRKNTAGKLFTTSVVQQLVQWFPEEKELLEAFGGKSSDLYKIVAQREINAGRDPEKAVLTYKACLGNFFSKRWYGIKLAILSVSQPS